MIQVCASQYRLETLPNWQAYAQKSEQLIQQAKNKGAQLILLPEYAGVEMACGQFVSELALFTHLQPLLGQYLAFYQTLAQRYQIYIQPGTVVQEIMAGQFVNRAYFFGPSGNYGSQDKLHLVTVEKQNQIMQQGNGQTLFKTALGVIGIAICYDSEFPEVVRKLVGRGATLILVPSYTPNIRSFHRVFYACRARAIENQCYVMMTSAVGPFQYAQELEQLIGQANIFSPIDEGFPEDGILSQGTMNDAMLLCAGLCDEPLAKVRRQGQVQNYEDSQGYYARITGKIAEVIL